MKRYRIYYISFKEKKHKGNQGISSLNITGNLREQCYLKRNKRERQSDRKFPDMYKNKKTKVNKVNIF